MADKILSNKEAQKIALRGDAAVQYVEQLEGRNLSLAEKEVIREEGFVPAKYKDTKGVVTYGVGQTGKWMDKPFSESFAAHEEDARKLVPSYDGLPEEAKAAIMSAAYRGDLQQSPAFRKLFNAGDYVKAAEEFLNNEDYRKAVKQKSGVARRMEKVASIVASIPELLSQQEPEIPSAMDSALPPMQTYEVQPGDTLFSISRSLNIPVTDLVELNGIVNPDQIQPGAVLNF